MAKEINYSEPFIIDTVFKDPPKLNEHTGEMEGGGTERCAQLAVLWEDIISIQSYPFSDTGLWNEYKGPKFYLTLVNQGTHLCLGSFKDMFKYWKECRNKHFKLKDGQDSDD